ncbi:MAG TPA: YDG domain-containing protein, partial [Gallionella sp.]
MKYHNSMNRICRLVWSQVQNTWVVATGDTKERGNSKSVFKPKLMAVTLALLSPAAFAAPMDGQISAGSGGIAQAGTTTTITQQTQNLAINWQSFDIGSNEAVHFNQPNSAAIALNRVLGQNPSQILGSLSANGQVFVLNPNGVLFGNAAQVNVGGLVASTLNISDADFMAGNNVFSNGGIVGGNVDNQGALNAANGGYIALISPAVSNTGSISAPQGTVALAAGNSVTLNLNNGSLLGYTIDTGTASALVSNGGMIAANGGQVLVTARGADALSAAVVNNTGIIEARTVQNIGGVIKLMADLQVGHVNLGGTLDASALDGGDGGFIETSAATVSVADNAVVTTNSALGQTGNWLIDPIDFTIAASGGDISGTTLSANLGTTGVTILSSSGPSGVNGDVNVNDVVSWSANKLTLNAQRNININANMNGSGTASLALEYGLGAVAAGNTGNYLLASNAQINLPSGLNFSTRLGSDGIAKAYTVINSLGIAGDISGATLQGMNGNLAGNYALGSNIDALLTSGWNAGAGFAPVGASTTQFTGNFDGLGHSISNLVINRPTTNDVGLFGYTATGSAVRNVGLVNGSVSGKNSGGLIGQNWGTISHSYFTGTVIGSSNNVGGLVGLNSGSISNSYATGSVSSVIGTNNVGGLAGLNSGSISNSYASVSVGGNNNVGGLVGLNNAGAISTSYATGSVTGSSLLGGLAGNNSLGTITDTYATGNVSGGAGSNNIGGLLGQNSGTVSTSYSIGGVSGTLSVGGLVGNNTGTIGNSYWDNQLSGQTAGIGAGVIAGATGLTTALTMQQSSFIGFDFTNVWRIYNGHTTPLLRSFLKQLTITASDVTKIYDATLAGLTDVTYSDPSAAGSVNLFGMTNSYGGATKNNVGVYAADIWSDQQGYDITLVGGQLTVTPANLDVNVTAANKVYDATTSATLSGAAITALGADIVSLGGTGSGAFADKNAGTGKTVTISGNYSISGMDAGNYNLIQPAGATADITRLDLALGGITAANKVYDATRTATLGGMASVTALDSDVVSVVGSGSGLFADKNAGTGKTVTVNIGGYNLSGMDAGNYNLIQPSGVTADITPRALTITAFAANRVYNAGTAATISSFANNRLYGDILTTGYGSAAFEDKNAGTGKTVNVSGITLGGTDARNYTYNTTATTTANITPLNIALKGVTAA